MVKGKSEVSWQKDIWYVIAKRSSEMTYQKGIMMYPDKREVWRLSVMAKSGLWCVMVKGSFEVSW